MHTLATLAFYSSNHGWQSFSKYDRPTKSAVKVLEKRGFLQVSWNTFQARFTGKVFSNLLGHVRD